MGVFDISTNMYYLLYSYLNLDKDALEITIIMLCCFLLTLTIYSRYIMLSFKPLFYKRFLADFDLSLEKQKEESREEVIIREMKK